MGITESETRTPPQGKSHCNDVALWTICDQFMMLSSQPANLPFLPSLMFPLFCHLIPSFSKIREQRGSLGKWDSSKNSYENYEELSTCRGTCWCLHCSLLWHGQLLKHKACRTELIKMATGTQKTGAATQQSVC